MNALSDAGIRVEEDLTARRCRTDARHMRLADPSRSRLRRSAFNFAVLLANLRAIALTPEMAP
ncbi:hypothetical protein [Bradyrhizobium sp. HKCCYLS2038]|uniref:hypothetical protein n=1 Tax=Bradyrhizobium sp. HKCCYLS2038 TaxID=3420764 RepID=UPI003EBF3BC4